MLAVGEHLIPDFDPRLVCIATPFGGGLGYGGCVCGSLTGAALVIGALVGRASSSERDTEAMRRTRKLRKAFEREFGTLLCREITRGKFHRTGQQRCRETVRFAARRLLEMFDSGTAKA